MLENSSGIAVGTILLISIVISFEDENEDVYHADFTHNDDMRFYSQTPTQSSLLESFSVL